MTDLNKTYDSTSSSSEGNKLALASFIEIIVLPSSLSQLLASHFCKTAPFLAEAMAEDTFIDDRNFLRYNDVLDRASRVFLTELHGATKVTPCSDGGGTLNDMP